MEERFSNELGNDIVVRVKTKDINGVEGILVSMSGPISDTELHITRAEAESMSRLLNNTLKNDTQL